MELNTKEKLQSTIDTGFEILDISEKIFKINENTNPNTIFKNKVFLISTEKDKDEISVEFEQDKKDSSYYFETSKIDGVIIKRENGNYCIKAAVKYTIDNAEIWFAKIRIELSSNKELIIGGKWGGSWEDPDYEDINQIKNPEPSFPLALESMKNNLSDIYNLLIQDNGLNSSKLDPEWVKQLKKYNN